MLKSKVMYIGRCINFLFQDKYLLYTNVGISTSLSAIGDTMEQHYEMLTDELDDWDKQRTRDMAVTGTTVGIVCHFWYKYLDRAMPGYTTRTVIRKVIVDQFVGSPLCISTFFLTISVVNRTKMENFFKEVKSKALKLYAAEWMVWPPAQFFSFYFLSTKYRVLFDNLISLGYDVYTSRIVNKPESC